jgi:hypothetical protein
MKLPWFQLKETTEDTIIQWQRQLNNFIEHLTNDGGYITVYNSDQMGWDRNLIANSEFTARDPDDTTGTASAGFNPRFWTISGTAVSVGDEPWVGARTLKISTSSNVTYNPDGITYATMNPQPSIDNGNNRMRFTAHVKGGTFSIRVYDQTNTSWFSLSDTEYGTRGTTLSYSGSASFPRRVSFSFDATEFSSNCADVRVYIVNTDAAKYVYVNAPQLSHDTDNAEPQEYRPGRYSMASANGVPVESLNLLAFEYINNADIDILYNFPSGQLIYGNVASPVADFTVEAKCDMSGVVSLVGGSTFALSWSVFVTIINVNTLEYHGPFIGSQEIGVFRGTASPFGYLVADITVPFIVHQATVGEYAILVYAIIDQDTSEYIRIPEDRFRIAISACSAEV